MMTWTKIKIAAGIVGLSMLGTGGAVMVSQAIAQEQPAPLVGELSNGVRIELVGVSENPPKSNRWWSADGTPTAAPYAVMGATYNPDAGKVAREFALKKQVQVAGADEPANLSWSVNGGGYAGGMAQDAKGNVIENMLAFASAVAPSPATVRIKIAAGKFKTRAENGNNGDSMSNQGEHAIIFSIPINSDGDAVIVVSHNYLDDNSRLLVTDIKGNQSVAQIRSVGMIGKIRQAMFYVPKTPLAQIRKFEFQTRPFDQWIEFSNVSVNAGEKTTPTVTTSDTAKPTPAGGSGFSGGLPAAAATDLIQPGDRLAVRIFDIMAPGLRTTFQRRVDTDHRIRIPEIGYVDLKNKNYGQAEQTVRQAIIDKRIIRDPEVSVTQMESAKNPTILLAPIEEHTWLRIRIFDLVPGGSSEFVVMAHGEVMLPHLKPIRLAGLTEYAAEETLIDAYRKANVFRNANLTVEMISEPEAQALRER